MKKQHGLKKRERLLLRLAAFLHDCGKYITLMNVGEASYEIIMSTEIIGLSHNERMIVASVVRYTYGRFAYYDELAKTHSLDPASYLVIAKLAAILRLAAALDKSHREKFKNISASLRGSVLNLTVDTDDDITLEKGSFDDKASFFEEIFSITPVIKKMRSRK
jgi:exopolyphosphatase/guanosine-5'-triphosphate,3'-diphosphate pyrophosphatase